MDEDRTFGIEIECLSSIPRSQLAEVINTAIAAQGHTCVHMGYYHNIVASTPRGGK